MVPLLFIFPFPQNTATVIQNHYLSKNGCFHGGHSQDVIVYFIQVYTIGYTFVNSLKV